MHKMTSAAATALSVVAAAATVVLLWQVAQGVERRWMPVLNDWTVTEAWVEGHDQVVTGYMRKVRNCQYIPPIRAITEGGRHLDVVSRAAQGGQGNWQATRDQVRYGPWVIRGGAGHMVELYAEHECHPLWRTFSALGTFDGRAP